MSNEAGSLPSATHPCQRCGACCAQYRVRFYWREAELGDLPNAVPVELTEDYSPFERVMKGTSGKHACRCVALQGRVGDQVECSIYLSRPSPCRAFQASFEDGVHRSRCDQARARYQLTPLTRKDWLAYRSGEFPDDHTAAKLEDHESQNFRS